MKCPVCNHKNNEWNNVKMKFECTDTEDFIKLPLDYLYACPKCNTVIYFKIN